MHDKCDFTCKTMVQAAGRSLYKLGDIICFKGKNEIFVACNPLACAQSGHA